jgi:ATP-dependent RNA helicase MSS116
MLKRVTQDKSLTESAEQAYRAWLGYYNGNVKKCGWSKKELVSQATLWAKDVGMPHQPSILKKTVGKMGLKGVPGLRVE